MFGSCTNEDAFNELLVLITELLVNGFANITGVALLGGALFIKIDAFTQSEFITKSFDIAAHVQFSDLEKALVLFLTKV